LYPAVTKGEAAFPAVWLVFLISFVLKFKGKLQ